MRGFNAVPVFLERVAEILEDDRALDEDRFLGQREPVYIVDGGGDVHVAVEYAAQQLPIPKVTTGSRPRSRNPREAGNYARYAFARSLGLRVNPSINRTNAFAMGVLDSLRRTARGMRTLETGIRDLDKAVFARQRELETRIENLESDIKSLREELEKTRGPQEGRA